VVSITFQEKDERVKNAPKRESRIVFSIFSVLLSEYDVSVGIQPSEPCYRLSGKNNENVDNTNIQ
jgi:hypothetical protein